MLSKNRYPKRSFDIAIVLITSVLWLPIGLVVFLAVWISLGRPVFFRQLRPGLHGRPFQMVKFRTMLDTKDEQGRLLPDDQRMTCVGRWLRGLSLDEFPEILNVLRGDMSLVGPRPLMMRYLERYSPEQARRHEVPPGITGWAQIHGRNAISWEQKFEYDVWYVDHHSFWLDLRIFFQTIAFALKREGINKPGHVTVDEFQSGKV